MRQRAAQTPHLGGSCNLPLHVGERDALRSHRGRCRAFEVAIAVHALNRMPELGRPEPVRIA